MRVPTSTCWSNRMRPLGPEGGVNVGGLPTSCSRTPQASVGVQPAGKPSSIMQRVRPDIAFGMELRRLFDAFHARDFGKKLREKARLVEKLETAPRGAFGEKLGEFVAKALGRNLVDIRGEISRWR